MSWQRALYAPLRPHRPMTYFFYDSNIGLLMLPSTAELLNSKDAA